MHSPNTTISKRYQRLKAKYHQLKKRLNHQLKNGTFYHFSKRKQEQLFQRLQRYFQRLQQLQKLAAPAALLSTALLCQQPLEAQTFTEVTDTNSPFVNFAVDTDAPFGLEVGYRPNPTFIDIDGDGDLDAFVGIQGGLQYFENVGSVTSPDFLLSTSTAPFGIEGNELYVDPVLVDIDDDGDLDAFVGNFFIYKSITFYRNVGNATSPNFIPTTETAPFGLNTNYGDSNLNLVDIDDDGDLDAFIGSYGQNIKYYENIGSKSMPNFNLTPNRKPFGLTADGYSLNSAFADIDNDGDLDAFIGNSRGFTFFLENTSNDISLPAFEQSTSSEPFGIFELRYSAVPSFADIDDDGDLDLLLGDYYGIRLFKNIDVNGNIVFQYPILTLRRDSNPSIVDIDNDGDLDLLVGEYDLNGNINYIRNELTISDTLTFNRFTDSKPFGLESAESTTQIDLIDIDLDGHLEAFITGKEISYFENISTKLSNPLFELLITSEPFGLNNIDLMLSKSPAFADIDNDGDFDCFIGFRYGDIRYYENISENSSLPNFELATQQSPFGLTDVEHNAAPTFADIDNDGDLDVFVGDRTGDINFFENISNDLSTPEFLLSNSSEPYGLTNIGSLSKLALGDVDNDGLYEAIIGEELGSLKYFESDIPISAPKTKIGKIELNGSFVCQGTTSKIARLHLINSQCDGNNNGSFIPTIFPPNRGVTAEVVNKSIGDCNFEVTISAALDAKIGNYQLGLLVQDADTVTNFSSVVPFAQTDTLVIFDLGRIEVLSDLEISPLEDNMVNNGVSEEYSVYIRNTNEVTTYEWVIGDLSLPLVMGNNADTGSPVTLNLENGNLVEAAANTLDLGNGITQSTFIINNLSSNLTQDIPISIVVRNPCGSAKESANIILGNYNCSSEKVLISNRPTSTGLYLAKDTLISQSIIPPDNGVAFVAGDEVKLLPNFHAQNGSTFIAKIEDCTAETEWIEERSVAYNASPFDLKLLPNPTTGESILQFNLQKPTELSLEIYDARGTLIQQVWKGQILESGQQQITLHLTDYDSGIYFIALRGKDGIWIEKLTILK